MVRELPGFSAAPKGTVAWSNGPSLHGCTALPSRMRPHGLSRTSVRPDRKESRLLSQFSTSRNHRGSGRSTWFSLNGRYVPVQGSSSSVPASRLRLMLCFVADCLVGSGSGRAPRAKTRDPARHVRPVLTVAVLESPLESGLLDPREKTMFTRKKVTIHPARCQEPKTSDSAASMTSTLVIMGFRTWRYGRGRQACSVAPTVPGCPVATPKLEL